MNIWIMLSVLYYCVSVGACVMSVLLFKRGFGKDKVMLSSYIGLSTLKGSLFCVVCGIVGLFFGSIKNGNNMVAVAIPLILPLPLSICAILSAITFGIVKLVPKTSKVTLPVANMQKIASRVNILVAIATVIVTIVTFKAG